MMKLLDNATLTELLATAADSPRRRANHNIHPVLEDPVQRFFNAMQPGTYVRPHRHSMPPRWYEQARVGDRMPAAMLSI
jgi:cupin fold WbuC family metalloprotein